jgi:hypothetical protein
MRTWNINREIPPYLTLAADYRLSAPQFTNDHIWELKMEGNEPPAMAVQTTYGLRAHRMRLFPRFIYNGKGDGVSDPSGFYRPPAVNKFFPNYLSLIFTPFPGVEVKAEYWVPASNTIAGRFIFNNHNSLTESFRFELAGILNPMGSGEGLSSEFYNGVNILKGALDDLFPVCLMSSSPEASNSPFATLSHEIELLPGNFRMINWAMASLNNQEASFLLAQNILDKPWDAEISRIEILNASQTVEISTGDAIWDEVFALSQQAAHELVFYEANNQGIPPFVLSRLPDQGFSLRGDGSDYPTAWNGPTALDAYQLFSILLPGGIEICEKILMTFLACQAEDGFINWKSCSTDPHQKILCQPLLAVLALKIHQYKEDKIWLGKIFPALYKFFNSWFSHELDRDGDGFPEWAHPHQTGLGESPLYDLWQSNSQFVSVQSLETPSLVSMLYHECSSLIVICKLTGQNKELQWLNKKLDQLRSLLEGTWNEKNGRYQYRDYSNHLSNPAKDLGQFNNGKHVLNQSFNFPSRLVLHIGSNNQDTRPLSISISGRDRKNNFTEKITLKDLTHALEKSVYTTRHDFQKIYQIQVTGLSKEDFVSVKTINYTQSDISLYLPLWSEIPLSKKVLKKVISTLVSDYFKPNGLPASPGLAPYVPLYWVNLVGEGLLNHGQTAPAVQLISNMMNGMSHNLLKYGALYEKFHAETGSPMGEKYRLSALAPIGLFLKSLGIDKLTSTSISLKGANPYPWPVTIKYRNLSMTMHQSDTTITFPNGQVINVSGPGPHMILIN